MAPKVLALKEETEAGGDWACREAGLQDRPHCAPRSLVCPHVLCVSHPRPHNHLLRPLLLTHSQKQWWQVQLRKVVFLPTF